MAWLSGRSKRIKLTIDHEKIDEDLSNFPVGIVLSSETGQTGFDATAIFDELITVSGTKKIAITTSDEETQCYVEIERWDWSNEKAWLHVKVPTITSGTNTVLYFYYDSTQDDNTTYVGDVGSTPGQTVWDSNFKAVYHMGEDPTGGSGCIKDSTSNTNDGTPGGSMTSGDLVDGKFGKALDFDGSDDHIDISTITIGANTTFSWIAKSDSTGAQHIMSGVNSSNRFSLSSTQVQLGFGPTHPSDYFICDHGVTITNWHMYTLVRGSDITVLDLYVDGQFVDSETNSGASSINVYNIAGKDFATAWGYYNGLLDEIRFSNNDRSATWIKATYEGLWDNLLSYSKPYTCSGTVQVDNVFTDGIDVRLYRRNTGMLIGETTTISEGLFEIESFYDEDHYIVALYTVSGTNALIYDYISP